VKGRAVLFGVGAISAAAALGAVGCGVRVAAEDDSAKSADAPLREIERRAVGPAVPYVADHFTDEDDARFAKSKRARRELGWRVLAKALAPIKPVVVQTGSTPLGSVEATVPLFRTWLGGDEVERVFATMYGDLGRERRLAHDPPTDAEVARVFDWNAHTLGPSSEADWLMRLSQVTTQSDLDGLGGNARVGYSPGYVERYLRDWPAIAGCAGKLESFDVTTPPLSDANFTRCFSREMDPSAAVVKASWRRNDAFVSGGLPVVDTSAASLAARLAPTDPKNAGGWSIPEMPLQQAGVKDAYTIRLSDQSGWSLVGLHLMTKELRHWVWVTAWWAPGDEADTDFGQDRPEAIKALGAPWNHYKMCVVTDFEERDPDARGGYDGSLGDALAAVHGPATWCSNPFLEKGAKNAQTNCIGCHQHAGDLRAHESVLTDEVKFPLAGRTLVRKAFPADYSWAFAKPASADQTDRLLDVVTRHVAAFAVEDRAPRPF
jgi:hypothetical protein